MYSEQVRETSHPGREGKGKKGSAKAGVTKPLPGYLQRGRDFGRGPRTLGPALVFTAARRDKGRAVTEAGLGRAQPLNQESPGAPDTEMNPELKPV